MSSNEDNNDLFYAKIGEFSPSARALNSPSKMMLLKEHIPEIKDVSSLFNLLSLDKRIHLLLLDRNGMVKVAHHFNKVPGGLANPPTFACVIGGSVNSPIATLNFSEGNDAQLGLKFFGPSNNDLFAVTSPHLFRLLETENPTEIPAENLVNLVATALVNIAAPAAAANTSQQAEAPNQNQAAANPDTNDNQNQVVTQLTQPPATTNAGGTNHRVIIPTKHVSAHALPVPPIIASLAMEAATNPTMNGTDPAELASFIINKMKLHDESIADHIDNNGLDNTTQVVPASRLNSTSNKPVTKELTYVLHWLFQAQNGIIKPFFFDPFPDRSKEAELMKETLMRIPKAMVRLFPNMQTLNEPLTAVAASQQQSAAVTATFLPPSNSANESESPTFKLVTALLEDNKRSREETASRANVLKQMHESGRRLFYALQVTELAQDQFEPTEPTKFVQELVHSNKIANSSCRKINEHIRAFAGGAFAQYDPAHCFQLFTTGAKWFHPTQPGGLTIFAFNPSMKADIATYKEELYADCKAQNNKGRYDEQALKKLTELHFFIPRSVEELKRMLHSLNILLAELFGAQSITVRGMTLLHEELFTADSWQNLEECQDEDKGFVTHVAFAIDHSLQMWISHVFHQSNYMSIRRDLLYGLVAELVDDLSKRKFSVKLPGVIAKPLASIFPAAHNITATANVVFPQGGGNGIGGGGAKKRKQHEVDGTPKVNVNGDEASKHWENRNPTTAFLLPITGARHRKAYSRVFKSHVGGCPKYTDPATGNKTPYCLAFLTTAKCHKDCGFIHKNPKMGSADYTSLKDFIENVYQLEADNLKPKDAQQSAAGKGLKNNGE